MPNFLETILAQLKRADGRVVLREIRGDQFVSVTGRELLEQIQLVRMFIRSSGVRPGARCALLAPNSIRWAVFHLAVMAEGMIVGRAERCLPERAKPHSHPRLDAGTPRSTDGCDTRTGPRVSLPAI